MIYTYPVMQEQRAVSTMLFTPNDTIDDNSTESIVDADAKSRLENVVVDVHVRKDGSES